MKVSEILGGLGELIFRIVLIALLTICCAYLSAIEESMKDWRPIRSYYFHDNRMYDVARVDDLTICDKFATEVPYETVNHGE